MNVCKMRMYDNASFRMDRQAPGRKMLSLWRGAGK